MKLNPDNIITAFITTTVTVIPFWFIFKKLGHSKWLAFLTVVPLVNTVVLFYVAFSKKGRLRQAGERDADRQIKDDTELEL